MLSSATVINIDNCKQQRYVEIVLKIYEVSISGRNYKFDFSTLIP